MWQKLDILAVFEILSKEIFQHSQEVEPRKVGANKEIFIILTLNSIGMKLSLIFLLYDVRKSSQSVGSSDTAPILFSSKARHENLIFSLGGRISYNLCRIDRSMRLLLESVSESSAAMLTMLVL